VSTAGYPRSLLLDEVRGMLEGPLAYVRSTLRTRGAASPRR
jgi:hypothetical protein